MGRRSKKTRFKPRFFVFLAILIVLVVALIYFGIYKNNNISNNLNNQSAQSADSSIKAPAEATVEDITIKMTVIGDIMCHNTQYTDAYNSSSKKYDFSYVFDDVKDKLSQADITVGNLETTFAGSKIGYSSYPTFNTPEALGKALKDVGLDVLSTANNHCMDKGYTGIVNTIKELDELKIDHMGTYDSEESSNNILVKDVKGIKIAFLAYTYGTNGIAVPKDKSYAVNLIDKDKIKKDLQAAKDLDVDLISVSMHWGTEYKQNPTDEQEELADFLFENGADIILGSHPHVLEKMEKRTIELEDGTTKDGFIIYSLGNFMSGQYYDYTRQSIILDLQITKHGDGKISIDSATYTPIYMYKSSSGSKQKYLVMDIEKALEDYKAGKKNISSSTNSILKSELKHIYKIVGDEITEESSNSEDLEGQKDENANTNKKEE